MNYCLTWIIALIVFVIIEALTYQLVTIWFALGALGAMLCALYPLPFYWQLDVFFGISVLALLLLRPVSMKYLKSKGLKTNSESAIGKTIVITEEVNNLEGTGKTKMNGVDWTVRSDDNSVITAGKSAVVVKIEGVKLIVREEK